VLNEGWVVIICGFGLELGVRRGGGGIVFFSCSLCFSFVAVSAAASSDSGIVMVGCAFGRDEDGGCSEEAGGSLPGVGE